MKIVAQRKDCRFWGYEPCGGHTRDKAEREAYKASLATIKAAGFKPVRMGFRARIAAIGEASRIEKSTGIEMSVYTHDYL